MSEAHMFKYLWFMRALVETIMAVKLGIFSCYSCI
jgi:hypothetical protein